jgi:hypothetical protein
MEGVRVKRKSPTVRVLLGMAIVFLFIAVLAIVYAASNTDRIRSIFPLDPAVYATQGVTP